MTTSPTSAGLLDELAWRGLLYQHTDGLRERLAAGQVTGYCGFDATAASLTVGNLVSIMGLVRMQQAGHKPIALVGGGTSLIGDPSGRDTERLLNTKETIEANAQAIRKTLERFLDFSGPAAAEVRNNLDWLGSMGAIDFMRDVGKHFTVNYMLAKESVKSRMEGGISYTEFSYMLLQSYDFLELFRRDGVTLQVGGSDQWGNITAGIELVRRVEGAEAHALTFPLVTMASGQKFGKTAAGAVWLDTPHTSLYKFFQFWVNADDRDVGKYLRIYTHLSREEIEALEAESAAHPEQRTGQRRLAEEVTTLVHGAEAMRVAREMSTLLFGGGDVAALSPAALEALAHEVPFFEMPAPAGDAVDTFELFAFAKLAPSKGGARRLLEQGGLYVNGRRLGTDDRTVPLSQLLPGRHLLLRKGARDWALVRIGA